MTVIAKHRFRINPSAEVGKQIGSQPEEADSRQRYEQHSQAKPVQGGFAPEDENKIHKRLDEKRGCEAEDCQQDCRNQSIQEETTMRKYQRTQPGKGRFRLNDVTQACRRRQKDENARPVLVKSFRSELAEPLSGIPNDHLLRGYLVDDNKMVPVLFLPVCDGRQRDLLE